MPVFLGMHDMGSPTDDETVGKGWADYKAACAKRGCKAIKVHYNAGQGKAYCVTEAASANDVQAAHEEIKLPLKDLTEVKTLE